MKDNNTERRKIGLEIHDAETAICLGRQVVGTLLACEPVDEAAILAQKAEIHRSRASINKLRRRLGSVQLAEELPSMRVRWTLAD